MDRVKFKAATGKDLMFSMILNDQLLRELLSDRVNDHEFLHCSKITPGKLIKKSTKMTNEERVEFLKKQNDRWSKKKSIVDSPVKPIPPLKINLRDLRSEEICALEDDTEIFKDYADEEDPSTYDHPLPVNVYCNFCFNNRANQIGWRKILSNIKLRMNEIDLQRSSCPVCPDLNEDNQSQKITRKKKLTKKIHKRRFKDGKLSPLIPKGEAACIRLLTHSPKVPLKSQCITKILKGPI